MKRFSTSLALAAMALLAGPSTRAAASGAQGPVRFNTAFEGAAVGRIDVVGETEFKVHVPGQQDQRGRNRQATWYYFRMDNVRGRELTLTLTGFLPGEYNDRPSPHMNGEPRPVFSHDGERWQHVSAMTWDDTAKEGRFTLRAEGDSLWLALVPPYTHTRLVRLLDEIGSTPHARVEVVGRSVLGRDLQVVTVTDFGTPDDAKKTVWLQARDHAWETPTSFIMEGALKFIVSDDPAARALRQKNIFVFTPMVDPDGCALGRVRFNAHGWDLNRHWDDVDLRDPVWLQRLPEVWYYKKAIRDYVGTGRTISLMVNLHNTIAEYLSARAPTAGDAARLQRLFDLLVARTQFDPSRPFQVRTAPGEAEAGPVPWWVAYRVPTALIETRIAPGRKLGGSPTAEHRLAFGRELLEAMAESVQ